MKWTPDECRAAVNRLTPRQREVLALLAEGLPRKEVASRLTIEVGTVNVNCENIYARLGVNSVAQAVVIYARAM